MTRCELSVALVLLGSWVSQGAIADRSSESLGRSDKGLILYRQMLEENVRLVEMGEDPMNTFRDPGSNEYLRLPTEESEGMSRMERNARFLHIQ